MNPKNQRPLQELIDRVGKLLDSRTPFESGNDLLKQVYVVRQDSLDAVNFLGFSENPIYSSISKLRFPDLTPGNDKPRGARVRLKIVRGQCAAMLTFLRSRLELAVDLPLPPDVSPSAKVLPPLKASFRPKL